MLSFNQNERERIEKTSRELGRKIIKLAKGKKSFGSFFLEGYSKKVMTYLPYFQHSIWGVPMNEEGVIWEYHDYNQLDQIKDYDFAIIFKYQHGTTNDIYLEPALEYGKNRYFIVIQTQNEEDIGNIRFYFLTEFMLDNPYLPECSLSDNPVKFDN